MIGLPGEPSRGQPIRAGDMAGLIRYVKSIAPRATTGSYSTVGSGGATRRPIPKSKWQWPQTLTTPTWPLMVYDASSGATPQIGVKPGAVSSLVPTLGGNPINAQVGSPLAWPTLTVGTGTTYCWFEVSYDDTNTPTSVLINTGGAVPSPATIVPGTAGTDYYGLSTLNATVTGSVASVQCLNDFISGNLFYTQCGTQAYWWSV